MPLASDSLLYQLRLGLFFSIALLLGAFPASSQQSEIFRLGQFDSSSQEFHSGSPDHAVRISARDPAAVHDWYAFQPDQDQVTIGASQTGDAPRTIAFQIAGAPAAHYTVHISLLIEHPSVPVLRVAINGHGGSFFLHPRLVETDNDEAVFFPSFSRADLSFDLPGAYVHPGENEISFAALPETTASLKTNDPQAPEPGFHYDAISMEAGDRTAAPASRFGSSPRSSSARSTARFKRRSTSSCAPIKHPPTAP